MVIFHSISTQKLSSNYNLPEEVESSTEPISFDGVYYNVYLNQSRLEGKDVTLFITGDYVGLDNSFDTGEPFEKFCDWNQIMDLVSIYRAKLGWHTWSHRDLTLLDDAELLYEVTPPFPMDFIAYPYGSFDERVIAAAKAAGFKKAYSVTQGDSTNEYALPRHYF